MLPQLSLCLSDCVKPLSAVAGILQTEDGADEQALGRLFMRIDANSDGSLDWDEFSNYMLLESQVCVQW